MKVWYGRGKSETGECKSKTRARVRQYMGKSKQEKRVATEGHE